MLSLSGRFGETWRRSAYFRHVFGWRSWMAPPSLPGALFEFAHSNFGILQLPDELLRFHAFLRSRSPRAICEIGTASGGHFYMLSQSLPSLTTLIGVDLNVGNRAFLRLLARNDLNVHLITGDSSSTRVRTAVERVVKGQGLDLLFIDGDHTYSGVRSDYLNYRGLVRDGGLISFHDIVKDHRARFGRETRNWAGDVPEFWERLKPLSRTLEFVSNPEQDGYGIGVLIHSATAAIPPNL